MRVASDLFAGCRTAIAFAFGRSQAFCDLGVRPVIRKRGFGGVLPDAPHREVVRQVEFNAAATCGKQTKRTIILVRNVHRSHLRETGIERDIGIVLDKRSGWFCRRHDLRPKPFAHRLHIILPSLYRRRKCRNPLARDSEETSLVVDFELTDLQRPERVFAALCPARFRRFNEQLDALAGRRDLGVSAQSSNDLFAPDEFAGVTETIIQIDADERIVLGELNTYPSPASSG